MYLFLLAMYVFLTEILFFISKNKENMQSVYYPSVANWIIDATM